MGPSYVVDAFYDSGHAQHMANGNVVEQFGFGLGKYYAQETVTPYTVLINHMNVG